jgi:hypothetical protein
VTRSSFTYESRRFLPDFVITPEWKQNRSKPYWNKFFIITTWPEELEKPNNFISLKFDKQPTRIYKPHPPFDLEEDRCSSWLTWKQVSAPESDDDEIRMLCIKEDTDLEDKDLPTEIATKINHQLWLEQMEPKEKTRTNNGNPQPPARDNLIKTQLDQQTNILKSVIHNTLENKLRYEFQRRFDNQRESRSPRRRSPKRDSPPRESSKKRNRDDPSPNIPPQQSFQQQQLPMMYGYGMMQQPYLNQMAMQQPILTGLQTNNNTASNPNQFNSQ